MKLGVCYYPEHWRKSLWREDARRMAEIGLSRVRIGEFAWSRLEPEPGRYDFDWLDEALEVLRSEGLEVVLGTPTATPPKWLIDRHPDIVAMDRAGRPRKFGSRRHYCFSSETYRHESARIVLALAKRYGQNPAVVAWQTDNEYGCHDTVESYSNNALKAFREWLARKYQSADALNRAWGCVFWSQEYRSFEEVDLPNLTVTEANPGHRLDFQRFCSDQVVAFNRVQTEILRAYAPGRDIYHNFMGHFTAFDHFDVAQDLDAATWDSYPLGFLEQGPWPPGVKTRFLRQGHPDQAAFHHDLYRAVGRGRWQVMEQQPGPVNWAPYNPAPLAGMVRLWTWEAFAHGAEVVSYFRWRQAPFGQEQNHAGLLRPDSVADVAAGEAIQVAQEIAALAPLMGRSKAEAAILFSYESLWLLDIQKQGASFDALELLMAWHSALRGLGLNVDLVDTRQDLNDYRIILAPSLPMIGQVLAKRLLESEAICVFGPRSGSKTEDFQIPEGLAPAALKFLLPILIPRVESLRPGYCEPVEGGGAIERWLEHVTGEADTLAATNAGAPVWVRSGRAHYIGGWPDAVLLNRVLETACAEAGLETRRLPEGLRLRRSGAVWFAFNYGAEPCDLGAIAPETAQATFVLGGRVTPPAGVSAWRTG